MNAPLEPSLDEAVRLGAVDDDFFSSYFFPRTFRQGHPKFSRLVQNAFDDPTSRYVDLMMYRGSSKTTRVRTRIAKHISYTISRTIMLVSNAQKHSIFSIKWLRKQVEYNLRWARAFDLSKGSTWSDEIIEIRHGVAQHSVYVLAYGITGQIRGINLDDFRPDFIVLDDPDNEETTATVEQRTKTADLVFGALAKSLAPPTEAPLAKLAILQTPLANEDLISTASKDASFRHVKVSCFDESGQSSWPERYPTAFLLDDKEMHIRLNKLSLWMREMECKLISPELSTFKPEWLRFWDELPEVMDMVIAVDPASSDAKTADDQVIGAIGFAKGNVYLCEYSANKGEMPDAATAYMFSLRRKYGTAIRKLCSESIAYQRVLAWYVEKQMAAARLWIQVDEIQDKRKKSDRIIQEIVGLVASGRLFVHKSHTKFIQQYTEYSPHSGMHDDVLDMLALGLMGMRSDSTYEGEFERITEDEKSIPKLDDFRHAP